MILVMVGSIILPTMSFIKRFRKDDKVYLAEVENKKINGKVVQRYIRYIGKEANGRIVLSTSISDVQMDQVKLYGPLMVLNTLAEEIGLSDHLGEYGNEILSMVYAHCLDFKSINQMETWFEKTDLNMILDLEGLTEERLLDAMDSLEKQDAEILQRNIFKSVKKKYRLKDSGILYDVTNTYLYGRKCPLGKLGHDKEGVKGRPLIQIGLGVTKNEGIPVFHKVFDGNIHDSRTFQDWISSFPKYGMKPGGLFIYDRGITSGKNLLDVKNMKWDTLCGIAFNEKLKTLWRPIAGKKDWVQFENRVRLNKTIFYSIAKPYMIDGIKGVLALCFNEQQKRDLKESRYDEISYAQELLNDHKKIKPGLEKYFDRRGKLNMSKLTETEEFDGYCCLFCTCQLQKEEMIRFYFDKDLIEKAFRSLKGITNLQPIRHWLYQRVIAHVFICYLSYLLLSLLKYRLRKIQVSPEEALRELDTMYKVYLKDSENTFKISRVVTLTKKQENILKTINKKLLVVGSE